MPLNHTPLSHEAMPCPELLSNGIGRVARRHSTIKGFLTRKGVGDIMMSAARLPRSFPEDAAVRCAIASFLLAFLVPTSARAADDKADLARQTLAILKASCYRCHGQERAAEGGFNFVLDRQRLVASRKIVPGNAAQSNLYKRMKKDEMPPEEEKPRPTEEEIAVIRKWIKAGIPDFNAAQTPRKEITPSAILDLIRADLEKAGERDRRFLSLLHDHPPLQRGPNRRRTIELPDRHFQAGEQPVLGQTHRQARAHRSRSDHTED